MNGGIRIGKIFGIQLRLDWSWIFIFILMTWSLMATFAGWHPEWTPAFQIAMAVVGSLLFFASVLLHELAHSVAAILQGLPVRNITLFLFGGISNIEREPPSARVELVTSIVGPALSIFLGIVLLTIGVRTTGGTMGSVSDAEAYTAYMTSLGPLGSLALWLGSINLMVGVFNMLPAFPLDGGRIFRSLLWLVTGDLRSSTRIAAGAGQVIGWSFVFLGIAMSFGARVPFFGTGFGSGLWLAFIGWFLSSAAAQSFRRVVLDEALEGLTVSALMRRPDATFEIDAPVSSLVYEGFMKTHARAFPVMDADTFVGLVSVENVRQIAQSAWDTTEVGAIMTPFSKLVTISPNDPMSEALAKLARLDLEQLPVVQAGTFVGLLARRDIGRWLEMSSGSVGPGRSAHA